MQQARENKKIFFFHKGEFVKKVGVHYRTNKRKKGKNAPDGHIQMYKYGYLRTHYSEQLLYTTQVAHEDKRKRTMCTNNFLATY
jgi:hypothetical protein